MKFIHAADLHIDSPMRGLARYQDAPEDLLRGASRRAFKNLTTTAIEEKVDLVVLAGDIFDGDWADFNTGLYFVNRLAELTSAGIKVVTLAGNHDAASKVTRELRLPDGAFKFGHDAPGTITSDQLDLEVAVHGQSYSKRDITSNLAGGYPDAIPGEFNIGVLHTALAGRPGHGNYAPCTEDDLRAKGYQYWALGHVHTREVVAKDPWIVFPGNLQGRNIRETGPKGFTVVTISGTEVIDVAHRDADTARWFNCQVDASESDSLDDVLEVAQTQLEETLLAADGRLAAVRVTITGSTNAHDGLVTQHESLENEIRRFATSLGDVWVEKVVLDTRRMVSRSQLLERNDGISDLLATIESLRGDPAALCDRFDDTFAKLRIKLPRESRGDSGINPGDPNVLAKALDTAESTILAVLSNGQPR